MPPRLTQEEFIFKAQQIHKNEDGSPKYGYLKVKYKNSQIKVIITCYKHGDFEQKPNDHLGGHGCKSCNTYTTDEYTKLAIKIHKNEDGSSKYDYSKVNYINANTKIIVICHKIENNIEHGEFILKAASHIGGNKSGCPKCAKNFQYNTEEWIKKSYINSW